MGLYEIIKEVSVIIKTAQPKKNVKNPNLELLIEKRSSNVSLFNITKRYLRRHLFQPDFLFLFFIIQAANILKKYLNSLLI